MGETPAFLAEPETTRESIMRATYLALCDHGYAGLTIQRIGESFGKSKSLLYHHYDDKDELLLAFLQFMLEEYESSLPEADAGGDALDRLDALLDGMLTPSLSAEERGFTAAMIELRAQAAHDERYREQFADHDRFFGEQLVEVVADGIESGLFRDVDADEVAEFLSTTVAGAMTRRVTGGGDRAATATRTALDGYVQRVLLADER
jgi:AcrR family transcriptional regulator